MNIQTEKKPEADFAVSDDGSIDDDGGISGGSDAVMSEALNLLEDSTGDLVLDDDDAIQGAFSSSTTKEKDLLDSETTASKADARPKSTTTETVSATTKGASTQHSSNKSTTPAIATAKSSNNDAATATGNSTFTTAARSSSITGSGTGPEAVSVERKEELLMEARVNRLQWIHQVPLPYRKAELPDDPWVQEEGLAAFLKTCHAAALMPSTTKVLSHLYGMEDHRVSSEQVAARIKSLLGSFDEDSPHKIVRPGRQLLEAEIAKDEGNPVLTGYKVFWSQLQTPECASLVQGMRTALRNLDSVEEPRSLDEIADRLLSYIHATFESLKTNKAWQTKGIAIDDRLKFSLESFLYGQCFTLLRSRLVTDETRKEEEKWMKRVTALEFVTPKHLDIACLTSGERENFDLEQVLAEPIAALLSVDLYFSPHEKLQRVLAMYHGINTALKKALNSGNGGGSEKLPSADDILPTIILTVLKAKPARMSTNLRVIEVFSPPEYLRGEAGYAFTNLFGAVQFLLDLDMKDPKSLSIEAEEFRKGLEESRAKLQERLEAQRKRSQFKGPAIDTEISLKYCTIPASEIRAAKSRGEIINLDWALEWQRKQMALDTQLAESFPAGRRTAQDRPASADEALPPGFSRNYTYLTSRPEDIRMSDLNQLLSEYRMLVHASETLLGERVTRLAADRKKKVDVVQAELLKNIQSVDPSLLPNTSM